MTSFDISVRGAGIFGLTLAWECAQRGARVELVDPSGVAAGASGGLVGALAPHVPENWNAKKQFQLESLLMARTFWPVIEKVSGLATGYSRAGRIQPVPSTAALDLADQRRAGAQELWNGHADWTITSESSGWQIGSPTGKFIFDTLSAHIHPCQACRALAIALAKRHGIDAVPEPAGTSKAVVWATGAAGLEQLSEGRPRPVGQGIKGQAALLDYDASGRAQLFIDGLHIIPHVDGTVAVGSTTEREFADPTGTDQSLDVIIEKARELVPELGPAAVLERWAGLRPRARSRAPLLGEMRDRPGHFVANGGFKIGFGMAPKIGQVMADLILENRNTIPEDFDLVASL